MRVADWRAVEEIVRHEAKFLICETKPFFARVAPGVRLRHR